MTALVYEVTVTAQDHATRERFVQWMEEEHAADMLAVPGCLACQVVEQTDTSVRCAYIYADQSAFDTYVDTKATPMRQKFMRVFAEDDLSFERRTLPIRLYKKKDP